MFYVEWSFHFVGALKCLFDLLFEDLVLRFLKDTFNFLHFLISTYRVWYHYKLFLKICVTMSAVADKRDVKHDDVINHNVYEPVFVKYGMTQM